MVATARKARTEPRPSTSTSAGKTRRSSKAPIAARDPVRAGKPIDFRLTPKQDQQLDLAISNAMHICAVGGARAAKTFGFVRITLMRALLADRSRHLIARYRFNHLKASILADTLPKVRRICFPTLRWDYNKSEGVLRLPNESEVWFTGLDESERVEKVLGQEYATIFCNECSQIPYSSILVLRTRLAQKIDNLRLKAFYDLNPSGSQHWTNQEFGQLIDPISKKPLADPENYRRLFMNPVDNAINLPPETLRILDALPGRYRQRFFEGIYVPEIDGALWSIEVIERNREPDAPSDLERIVVGVDPSGTKGKGDKRSNSVGIVVCGVDRQGVGYVLEDCTTDAGPSVWGAAAVAAFRRWKADAILGEMNFGGDMVRHTIHTVDPGVPFIEVTASRGKVLRAEPIASLYSKGMVRHAGRFPELEEQMTNMATNGFQGEGSPDRVDAAVHALTNLLVGHQPINLGSPLAVDAGVPSFVLGGLNG